MIRFANASELLETIVSFTVMTRVGADVSSLINPMIGRLPSWSASASDASAILSFQVLAPNTIASKFLSCFSLVYAVLHPDIATTLTPVRRNSSARPSGSVTPSSISISRIASFGVSPIDLCCLIKWILVVVYIYSV